jgi:adenine deaminase
MWVALVTFLLPRAAAAAEPVDLVVRNATVVTVDAQRRVIPRGAVAIQGGRIVAVGPAAEVADRYQGREVSTPAAASSCPASSTPTPTPPWSSSGASPTI